jgi:hypothetical protein
MSRRRNRDEEPSPFEHFIDALLTLPWWAGAAVSVLLYVSMRWLIPWMLLDAASDTPKLKGTVDVTDIVRIGCGCDGGLYRYRAFLTRGSTTGPSRAVRAVSIHQAILCGRNAGAQVP